MKIFNKKINKIKSLLLLVILVLCSGFVIGGSILFGKCDIKISDFYLENNKPIFSEDVQMFLEIDNKCEKKLHIEVYEGANLLFSKDNFSEKADYKLESPKDGNYELSANIFVSDKLRDSKKLVFKINTLRAENDNSFRIYNPINAKKLIFNSREDYYNAIIHVENARHETVFASIGDLYKGSNAIEFDKYLKAGDYKISTATNSMPVEISDLEISGI